MTKVEEQVNENNGMLKVLISDSTAMKKTLYGNGQPGVVEDLIIVKRDQTNCPARKAAGRDKLTRAVAVIMCSFGLISTVISVISVIVLLTNKQPS